ncbi:hypothetical protein EI546_09700 [Aequorivita sp. H23M31]|uniref:Bacterial surface antigen (D15) domain-containing protein n=1 Tax=Aequorivita ciconiae TaxID=2494375 RepID=A0A410G7I6_9FLAO|nr:hypothetical protein EI546_09700 [Aequorivita sp. H23M31]
MLILFLSLGSQLFAQDNKTVKDSTDIYKKIETYSKKSKFTKLFHKWIFRPTKREHKNVKRVKPDYKRYTGKIVRNIIINSKDPFGYSITDTTATPHSWLEKAGNTVHIKSKEMAIRNFLLLKENKPLDTFLIAESARLLRKQNFIREVKITPKSIPNSKDSVDVIITTLDSWSLVPKGSYSKSEISVGARERNIMGTGHELNVRYSNRRDDGDNAFDVSYTVPNFKNTFIASTVQYKTEYDNYFDKNISIDRPFYSPLTRWAGGILLRERYLGLEFPDDSLIKVRENIRFLAQDYWGGHAFKLLKGDSETERSTNLIVSARALIVNYREKPPVEYDSINFFSGERFYLFSTGITSRRFVEDSYIFKDGIIEDVPVGLVYSITGGVQNKNHINRMYLGGQIFYGNYFQWGFLSTNFELGTFFNKSITEQTAYSFNVSYFSNLLNLGGEWKMRQFVKPQIIIGINRLNSYGDRISLNDDVKFSAIYDISNLQENGSIEGFDGIALGTKKYVLALQTQFYSPWELWGFRLNPFVNITGGMLTGGENSFGTNKIYSSVSIGAIIRNDYLVFDSFQFSLTYYPEIPGQGDNIFKTNSYTSEDFGFEDFEIGKPHTVIYK